MQLFKVIAIGLAGHAGFTSAAISPTSHSKPNGAVIAGSSGGVMSNGVGVTSNGVVVAGSSGGVGNMTIPEANCTGNQLYMHSFDPVNQDFCGYLLDNLNQQDLAPHKSYMLMMNGTQFYVCNYANISQTCDDNEVKDVADAINRRCGQDMSGYFWNHKTQKMYGFDINEVIPCPGVHNHSGPTW